MLRNKKDDGNTVHECRCQRSYCLKNYCKCYNANRSCGKQCKCLGCKNNQFDKKRDNENLTSEAMLPEEAIKAVIRVMIAQAKASEEKGLSKAEIEKAVLIEFSSCFNKLLGTNY